VLNKQRDKDLFTRNSSWDQWSCSLGIKLASKGSSHRPSSFSSVEQLRFQDCLLLKQVKGRARCCYSFLPVVVITSIFIAFLPLPQPDGDAIALLLVPTLHGGDTRVFLWNRTSPTTPTHILTGHSEAVLEVQWLDNERLASWSRDRTLRIWTINNQLRLSLGGSAGNIATAGSLDDSDGFSSTPSLSVTASSLTTSTTPTDTPTDGASSAGTPLMKMSFEEIGMGEALGGRGLLGIGEGGINPTLSLPVIRTLGPSDATPTMGGAGGIMSSGSPSTHSLTSLSSVSSQSTVNPVFQSIGAHSLAKEFSQLRTDNISNLEVERVSKRGGGAGFRGRSGRGQGRRKWTWLSREN